MRNRAAAPMLVDEAPGAAGEPCQFGVLCERPALERCMDCGLPTCTEHSVKIQSGGILCITCVERTVDAP